MAKKIPDAITLIHINQYNTKTKFREKKLDMLIKIPDKSCLLLYITIINIVSTIL